MDFMNEHWDFVVLLFSFILSNVITNRVHNEKIRTLEKSIEAIKQDKRELFERTRFIMTTSEVISHIDKTVEKLQDTIDKHELKLRISEEKMMDEIKEIRRDVNQIRQRCSGCRTRESDK